jgi:hypothetical protein
MTSEQAHNRAVAEADALELAPGTKHENLEGWIPELATPEEVFAALEKAFDYRGDVTLTLKAGRKIAATSSTAVPAPRCLAPWCGSFP